MAVINLGNVPKGVEVFASAAEKQAVSAVRDVSKAIVSTPTVKKKKSKTQKKVEGLLTAAAAAEVIALTALVAPVLLPVAATIGLPVAAIGTFAPGVLSMITSSPELTKVAVATAISPAAGIVVGAEEGVNVLGAVLGQVPEIIKEKTPEIIAGAGGLALGVGAVLTTQELLTKQIAAGKAEKEAYDLARAAKKKLPSDSAISSIITPAASVPEAVGVPITPTPPITPETVSMEAPKVITPQKTAPEALRQKISQKVRISMTQNTMNRKYINKHSHKRRWRQH